MDFTQFWDDTSTIFPGDYVMFYDVFERGYVLDERIAGAAEDGALFRVEKVYEAGHNLVADILWQDDDGNPITESVHLAELEPVVIANLTPCDPCSEAFWECPQPEPTLSLRVRTCQAYEDDYLRLQDEAMAKWGHMPISFEEYMAEKLDFAGRREVEQSTSEHWQKKVSDLENEVLELKREKLRLENQRIDQVNTLRTVLQAISQVDADSLVPIEALTKLYEFKRAAGTTLQLTGK